MEKTREKERERSRQGGRWGQTDKWSDKPDID